MFLKRNVNWNLLAKYVAGETSEKEGEAVQKWSAHSTGNKALLEEIKSDWKKMDRMNARFDVDNAWNKLHDRLVTDHLHEETSSAKPKSRNFVDFSPPIRIAASLVLLAILGVALFALFNRFQTVQVMASVEEKGKMVNLPDGSTVYLNSNASLQYARNFGNKNREVNLRGEAFFEVTPGANNPFRIVAGNARIKVLGTSFNVKANNSNNQVEVYVSTGIVELSEASDEQNKILLRSGSIGIVSEKSLSMKSAINKNSIAWKTGDLLFEETPLSEVIPVLNSVYNVNIVITDPGIDTTRIDGEYHGDPLDQILHVICTQNQENRLKVAKDANTIYLSR